MALDAKEKKQEKFWEQVESSVSAYNKVQKDYETAMIKMEDYVLDKIDNLPIRLISPLSRWKRRKCGQKMPSKRTDLLIQWNQKKHHNDMTLEEYLATMTIIFKSYEKMIKGKVLTMSMIETKLLGHHNVATLQRKNP